MNYRRLMEEIAEGGILVVDFYQNDCRFCDLLKPQLEEAVEATGVRLVAINLSDLSDEDRAEMLEEFDLMSTPTVLIYDEEFEEERFSGFRPAAAIEEMIAAYL